ncbi:tRNA pseudouridine(38-40) synthase TruA, partial [Bacillus thuringiensis]|nr:tRNA pseudouridine(38-40) synthase TruA [Bacillus thuringiensis]
FESFSKRNTQTRTFKCTIMQSYWQQQGEELQYIVEANRFLRGMVRGLVATQLQVARGKYTIEEFRKIIEARDCTKA